MINQSKQSYPVYKDHVVQTKTIRIEIYQTTISSGMPAPVFPRGGWLELQLLHSKSLLAVSFNQPYNL